MYYEMANFNPNWFGLLKREKKIYIQRHFYKQERMSKNDDFHQLSPKFILGCLDKNSAEKIPIQKGEFCQIK